jgi:hypothetical protein
MFVPVKVRLPALLKQMKPTHAVGFATSSPRPYPRMGSATNQAVDQSSADKIRNCYKYFIVLQLGVKQNLPHFD